MDGTVDIPRFPSNTVAADVREKFAARQPERVAEVAVCEGDRLVGLVSLERLLAARADTPLASLIEAEPVVVRADVDLESVALQAAHEGAKDGRRC